MEGSVRVFGLVFALTRFGLAPLLGRQHAHRLGLDRLGLAGLILGDLVDGHVDEVAPLVPPVRGDGELEGGREELVLLRAGLFEDELISGPEKTGTSKTRRTGQSACRSKRSLLEGRE